MADAATEPQKHTPSGRRPELCLPGSCFCISCWCHMRKAAQSRLKGPAVTVQDARRPVHRPVARQVSKPPPEIVDASQSAKYQKGG